MVGGVKRQKEKGSGSLESGLWNFESGGSTGSPP